MRALSILLIAASIDAADTKDRDLAVGEVNFATSGGREAQIHFVRGVAALHSFWYEEALEEFRRATKIDPSFAMGYWGEAMAHNHPIWGDPQNTEAAKKALAQIKEGQKLIPRERAYIDAVKALYGQGDKANRDRLYAEAMQRLHRQYPDDLEGTAFYALALLGSAAAGPPGQRRRMEAAALASEVIGKKPNHPGATHYLIHAFDDPDHAILALPAARKYAKVAPDAYHALHMPSHIFLQLGMWPEAAASNEAAWAASKKSVAQRRLPRSMHDYHSLHWLIYVYLQQGRYREAEELLGRMRKSLDDLGDDPFRRLFILFLYSTMAGIFVVETERWDIASTLAEPLQARLAAQASQPGDGAKHGSGSHGQPAIPDHKMVPGLLRAPLVFAQGLAAATKGNESRESIADLEKISKAPAIPVEALSEMPKVANIQQLEIAAAYHASKSRFEEAIRDAKKAAEMEQSLAAPMGPPVLLKPANELYGEILLRAGRAEEAAQQFAIALTRHPNRGRSLLGAARTAAKRGDATAAGAAYSKFLNQWKNADPASAELSEALAHSKGESAAKAPGR